MCSLGSSKFSVNVAVNASSFRNGLLVPYAFIIYKMDFKVTRDVVCCEVSIVL